MLVCGECGELSAAAGRCPRDGTAFTPTDDGFLGTSIGPYRLARLLGRGGMGRVYLGVQPSVGGRVAIKLLSDDACDRPDQIDRFFTEARAVNLIRHESIVRVFDFTRSATGRPAIVMELVEGQTLRAIIRAGGAPLGGVVQLMTEVLLALAAAHAAGIVHRDLKPDNIMVTPNGGAKILDFGIAKLATDLPEAGPRTRSGVVLGTPHYMSPEQIRRGTVDARADVYSAGVVLFEAVTGERPFDGAGDFEVLNAHINTPPPSPRALRPELPAALADVIVQALAKRRGDRFPSANAMANALHAASAELPASEWRSLAPHRHAVVRAVEAPAAPPPPTLATAPLVPIAAEPGAATTGAAAIGVATTAAAQASWLPGPLSISLLGPMPAPMPAPVPNIASGVLPGAGARRLAGLPPVPASRPEPNVPPNVPPSVPIAPSGPQIDRSGEGELPPSAPSAASPSEPDVAATRHASSSPLDPGESEARPATPPPADPDDSAVRPAMPSPSDPSVVEARPATPSPSKVGEADARPAAPPDSRVADARPTGAEQTVRRTTAVPPRASGLRRAALPVIAACAGGAAVALVLHLLQPGKPAGPGEGIAKLREGSAAPSDAEPAPRPSSPAPAGTTARANAPSDPDVERLAPDFDRQHFVPTAYLATARALARKLVPDAELTLMGAMQVASDGSIDVDAPEQQITFGFRSPTWEAKRTGAAVNTPPPVGCGVYVTIKPEGAVARLGEVMCRAPIVRPPHCTFRDVWRLAYGLGAAANRLAAISWVMDSSATPPHARWVFITNQAGNAAGASIMLDDDCPR